MTRIDELARVAKRAAEILYEMKDAIFKGPEFSDLQRIDRGLRPFAERLARAEAEPSGHDLLTELRDALCLPNVARPETPQEVWRETLDEVKRMVERLGIAEAAPVYRNLRQEVKRRQIAEAEVERLRADRDYMVEDRNAHCERADCAEADLGERRHTPQPEEPTFQGEHRVDIDELAKKVERLERAVTVPCSKHCEGGFIKFHDGRGDVGRELCDCALGEIAREVGR